MFHKFSDLVRDEWLFAYYHEKPRGLPYTFLSCSLMLTALMNSTAMWCRYRMEENLNPFLLYFFRPLRPQACLTQLFLSECKHQPFISIHIYLPKLTIILLISISNSIESISINRGKIWQNVSHIYLELMMMLTIYPLRNYFYSIGFSLYIIKAVGERKRSQAKREKRLMFQFSIVDFTVNSLMSHACVDRKIKNIRFRVIFKMGLGALNFKFNICISINKKNTNIILFYTEYFDWYLNFNINFQSFSPLFMSPQFPLLPSLSDCLLLLLFPHIFRLK